MSKMIAFDQEALESMLLCCKLVPGLSSDASVQGAQRNPQSARLADGPKYGVTVANEMTWMMFLLKTWGPAMVREVASKTQWTWPATAPRRHVLAEAIFNEGLRAVVAGVHPIQFSRD